VCQTNPANPPLRTTHTAWFVRRRHPTRFKQKVYLLPLPVFNLDFFFEGTEGAEVPTEIKLKNKSSPVTRQRAQETKKETKKLG